MLTEHFAGEVTTSQLVELGISIAELNCLNLLGFNNESILELWISLLTHS